MILAPTLSLNTPARGYDADATAFAAASGATDVAALSAFVKGVKELGLWNSMVCWPLRSSQNAGTGTTAYSLGGLGTFNGTLTNGPTWGTDGITVAAGNHRILTSFNYSTGLASLFGVIRPDSAAAFGSGDRFMGNDRAGTSEGIAFDGVPAGQFRLLSASLANAGTRIANTRTLFGHGYGTNNTFWFQDGAQTVRTDAAYVASIRNLAAVGSQPENFVNTMLGQYSFTVAFDGVTTTSSLLSSFYNLYRATLGTGLGLP
jgi:hypothetical protein